MSVLNDGKFGHGFASAGLTEAFSGKINHIDKGNSGFSPKRVFVAALLGGTTSRISGGKFWNGAVTGAFSRAFSKEVHKESETEEQHRRNSEYNEWYESLSPEYKLLVDNSMWDLAGEVQNREYFGDASANNIIGVGGFIFTEHHWFAPDEVIQCISTPSTDTYSATYGMAIVNPQSGCNGVLCKISFSKANKMGLRMLVFQHQEVAK